MSSRLSARRAVVTGGANGLGAAIARLFADEGAQVAILDLAATEPVAHAVIADIESGGRTAWFVETDVLDVASAIASVDRAAQLMGGVDAVIASAGVASSPRLVDLDVDAFDAVMGVNLRGVFLTCQRAAQLMIDAGHGGTIVTLASMASKRPTAGVYSVSKAAVWMMTRCLAHELGRYGIRCNAVGPGYVDTALLRSMVVAGAGDDPDVQAAWLDVRRQQVSLGRFGTPDDVARTALFLTSDESAYFTGSLLHPDGGYTSTFGGGGGGGG